MRELVRDLYEAELVGLGRRWEGVLGGSYALIRVKVVDGVRVGQSAEGGTAHELGELLTRAGPISLMRGVDSTGPASETRDIEDVGGGRGLLLLLLRRIAGGEHAIIVVKVFKAG